MEIKYDVIGTDYNLTRKADRYITNQLLLHLKPNISGKYLDIGCGTGNYTNELQKKGYQFIGMDPSKKMLEKARHKNDKMDWVLGSVENIGLGKNVIDGVIGTLTIHHWADLNLGFSELYKVLKPKGRVVIFTSTPKQMEGYWLNYYFPKMLKDSIEQMPSLEKIKTAMKDSEIKFLKTAKYFVQPDLQDQFLYCGKHKPELYFNDQIRHGISSFSSLSNAIEVEDGLVKLRNDIESGIIKEVLQSYKNDLGDYLFVIGEKF